MVNLRHSTQNGAVSKDHTRSRSESSISPHGKPRNQQQAADKIEQFSVRTASQRSVDVLKPTSSSSSTLVPGPSGWTTSPAMDSVHQLTKLYGDMRNMKRAIQTYRVAFMAEASKLVSSIALPVEGIHTSDLKEIPRIFPRLQRLHDAYGALEDDHDRLDRQAEECERTLFNSQHKSAQHEAEQGFHLYLPNHDDFSDPSDASIYNFDEVLFWDWLTILARAEGTFKALQELAERKTNIIETIPEFENEKVTISPFPADLISDLDRQYRDKTAHLHDIEEQLMAMHTRLKGTGFVLPDDILDFKVGILTENPPPRNPLLLPLDRLMDEEVYDNADDLQLDRLMDKEVYDNANANPNVTSAQLADHINAWLLHNLCRSTIEAFYLARELESHGMPMNEETAQKVREFWAWDEPTQRLLNMSGSDYMRRGSNNPTESVRLPPLPWSVSVLTASSTFPAESIEFDGTNDADFDPFADVDLDTVPVIPVQTPILSVSEEAGEDSHIDVSNFEITCEDMMQEDVAMTSADSQDPYLLQSPPQTSTQELPALPKVNGTMENLIPNPTFPGRSISDQRLSDHFKQTTHTMELMPTKRPKSYSDPLSLGETGTHIPSSRPDS